MIGAGADSLGVVKRIGFRPVPMPRDVATISSPVLDEWRTIHARWAGEHADIDADFATPETANVLG